MYYSELTFFLFWTDRKVLVIGLTNKKSKSVNFLQKTQRNRSKSKRISYKKKKYLTRLAVPDPDSLIFTPGVEFV